MMRRAIAVLALTMFALSADAIDASNRYRSPRNPERKVRSATKLIILHTTEAPAKSSLDKLSDRGECHFCVTEDGSIYRIIDRDKVAFHAGRSMWDGVEDVDEFSIGIECVGYHNKEMGVVQLHAIRDLVKELQSMYRLPDDRVICHSHVAYGAPNKWHRFKHRGRKRCGMLFAMPSVRRVLGLDRRPLRDEDVRAGRLRNADEYLRKVLYGNVDTMRSACAKMDAAPRVEEKSSGIFSWLGFGSRTKPSASASPKSSGAVSPKPSAAAVKTKPEASVRPKPTTAVVKANVDNASARRTSAAVRAAARTHPQSIAQLMSMGYVARGAVTRQMTAKKLVGDRWNASDTYYTIRNKVVPGNTIDPAHIELGMTIWTKK